MEFLHYKAGDFHPEWRTGQEYVQADYLDPWWQIVVGYPGITEQEISDITRGPLRLGFVRINDSLFFLLKVGNNPWFDAPYEPRFKMNKLDYQTNIPEGKGAPMLICAVDTASGELKEMRVISLGHLQSEHLHQHCRELDQKRPMNPSTYNMIVDRIYQQYPSSDLMARLIRAEDIIMIP